MPNGNEERFQRRRPAGPARPRARRRRGQAMMEFAVTSPFLLVLAVSIADYGYYLEHVNNITTVVRDATRYASENTTAVSWSPACPNPTWSGSTGAYSCPVTTAASGNVEGLIQYEAESLTVPEGGLALDNIDCNWSGGNPPAAGDPSWTGTPSIPTSFPAGSGATGTPSSCISVVYYTSTGGTYSSSSLSASSDVFGWYSANANSDAGCFLPVPDTTCPAVSSESYPGMGTVVEITVMYAWSSTNPGPVFDVLNSAFGLKVDITAQYSLVVEN